MRQARSTILLNLSERTNRILRKLDHSMIFVLIAGSYTPICLIVLKGPVGYFLFALVWAIALIGIIVKSAGSPVRNGFLLCFISAWAGSAYWLSHRLSIRSLRQLLDVFLAGGIILHCRRHHLCFESSAVRCKAQKFRLT